MIHSYNILLDINKDLENRVIWCNKISYNIDRKERIIDKHPETVAYLKGKTAEQSKVYMENFLTNQYTIDNQYIEKVLNKTNKELAEHFSQTCEVIEKITWRPLYRNNFTIYLTTFPRGPYNYKDGSFLFYIYWDFRNIVWFFLHEILHLQFIHYFRWRDYIKELTPTQFEMLKESLTVILNEEAKELLFQEDKWYTIHTELRKKLLAFRLANKDFDKLVEFWAKEVINYSE